MVFPLPDEMDQAPPARSEYLVSGIRTPPVRRNSKLATLGRIFKPWKWRKKKNEKLKQTTSGEHGGEGAGAPVMVLLVLTVSTQPPREGQLSSVGPDGWSSSAFSGHLLGGVRQHRADL